jgi:tetratricopeptide (TPR) repeat protein
MASGIDYNGLSSSTLDVAAPVPVRLTARDTLACLAVLLLATLLYLNTLHNPFVYDDERLIVANQSIEHLGNLRAIVWHEVTRPVVNFTYAVDYAIWGRSTFGFHLTNLLLHLLNIGLVYLLAWRTADDRRRRGPPGVDDLAPSVVAFGTAMLFAAHPMMTEAVGYVSGRAEILCATLFVIAVLTMRRYMQGGGPRWLLLSLGVWLLALGSKENAVMFPFVILAYDWLVCPGTDADRRRRLMRLHLPIYLVGVTAVIIRLVVFARVEHAGGFEFVWPYILAEADVLRQYLLLLMMFHPSGQAVFHSVTLARTFSISTAVATATLGFVVWLVVATRRAGRPAAAFGLLWFLLLLLPSSALVVFDHGEPMAEHRVYAASMGLFLALAVALAWLNVRFGPSRPIPRRIFRVVMVIGVISLAGHTVIRNATWHDPVTLWADAVDKAPDHWFPHVLLGESLHAEGRHAQAVVEFQRSIALRPTEAATYGKAGICLVESGRFSEAQTTFEAMRKIDPWAAEGTNGLGTVALARDQLDLARLRYEETLRNNPQNVPARIGLAAVDERTGRPAEAFERCQEIQQLAPGTPGNDDCLRRNRHRAPTGPAAR